ncbi:hypothetical protein ABK040_006381 [Willaertia magna]
MPSSPFSLLSLCATFFILLLAATIIANNIVEGAYIKDYNFVKAIDVAIMEMLEDEEYRAGYLNFGLIYPIPECGIETLDTDFYDKYPSQFPFTTTSKTSTAVINLCYENDTNPPWAEIHEFVGRKLVEKLNKRYKLNLKPNFQIMDTSKLGYFDTLKQAVDTGYCDVSVASTNYEASRAHLVKSQCAYGSTSPGFLRSSLDPSLQITTIKDLNQSGIKVAVLSNTIYEKLALKYLQGATLIPIASGYTAVFEAVEKRQVHAILSDVFDLYNWLKRNKEKCGVNCYSKGFDSPFTFATFVTTNFSGMTSGSSAKSCIFVNVKSLFYLFVMLLVVILLI